MARHIAFVGTIALLLTLVWHSPGLALPDAVVIGIDAAGQDFREGDVLKMTVRVKNQGSSPLAPVPVAAAIGDEHRAEWVTPGTLDPGAVVEWEFAWTSVRGSYVVVAAVDPLNDVAESDEANNSGFISLGVAEKPDPSPWPAALAGLGSFLAAAAAGIAIQRYRLARRRRRYVPRRPQGGENSS